MSTDAAARHSTKVQRTLCSSGESLAMTRPLGTPPRLQNPSALPPTCVSDVTVVPEHWRPEAYDGNDNCCVHLGASMAVSLQTLISESVQHAHHFADGQYFFEVILTKGYVNSF